MAKANRFAKNDQGVSAVIGVILMVAITVILAAVIAAFVFGMVGNVNNKKNPAFTVKRISNGSLAITLQDKGGATTIDTLTVQQPAAGVTGAVWTVGGTGISVGATQTLTDTNPAAPVLGGTIHLVATAIVDGNSQVVIDTTV